MAHENELSDISTLTLPADSWTPWLQCILRNVHLHIHPPAALASGRRSLEDKVRTILYMWSMETARTVKLDAVAASYISHTSDLGVESSIPNFQCRRPLDLLLPDWLCNTREHQDTESEIDIDVLESGRMTRNP